MAIRYNSHLEEAADLMKAGLGFTGRDLRDMFDIRVPTDVVHILNQQGIDVREIQTKRRGPKGRWTVQTFFFVDAEYAAGPGLGDMCGPEDMTCEIEGIYPEIAWQQGHYVMWVCPAVCNPVNDNADPHATCDTFHKVDTGDDFLTQPRIVRCKRCGRQYTLMPRNQQ